MRKVTVSFVVDADSQTQYGCTVLETILPDGFIIGEKSALGRALFYGTFPLKAKAGAKKPKGKVEGQGIEWSAMPDGSVVAGKVEGAAHWFIGGEWQEAKAVTPPAPPKAPAPPAPPKAPAKKAVK